VEQENKKALPEVRERCKQAQYTLGGAPGQKTPNHDRERNNVIILCGLRNLSRFVAAKYYCLYWV
jgi:hypothetical protein